MGSTSHESKRWSYLYWVLQTSVATYAVTTISTALTLHQAFYAIWEWFKIDEWFEHVLATYANIISFEFHFNILQSK